MKIVNVKNNGKLKSLEKILPVRINNGTSKTVKVKMIKKYAIENGRKISLEIIYLPYFLFLYVPSLLLKLAKVKNP
ncbi:hypothetical protein KEJ50_06880 [Candidatus Bathyarchaeota archaeon]|nr:hypothetical protein [Candidatus Bathyarchaeota archaeon]